MNLKIEFAKNKCLGTSWSTEMIPIAWTYPAREHYKSAYFLWLTFWPPLCSWPIFFNTISAPDCKRRLTQQYLIYLCTDINLSGLSLVIFLRTVLSDAFLLLSGIVCTLVRPSRLLGLIRTQTVWHSDVIPERNRSKKLILKKSADEKKNLKKHA